MPGDPLRHFVILWQTGGYKNSVVSVHILGCLQGVRAFAASATTEHKGQLVHVLYPYLNQQ
jgi:hypothetical protein